MHTAWLKGLQTPEERARIKAFVLANAEAYEKAIDAIRTQRRSPSTDYSLAAWPYKQAHDIGFNEALDLVEKILTADTKG